MKCVRAILAAVSSVVLAGAVGCAHSTPPPPPPPPYAQMPPLVQLADHNGFETGRADGERAAGAGYPFAARSTRAYHDTPGYDPALGPFPVYRNAFRNAYLRGYDKGFYRR
jgi:hypothetical protein